ncbi:hypothetical protein IMZ48_43715 [Candidatus Bathyarchaeota archaeon]|nr:hypothetical protein [Candidatus Bathyarchaeota archaeon]
MVTTDPGVTAIINVPRFVDGSKGYSGGGPPSRRRSPRSCTMHARMHDS